MPYHIPEVDRMIRPDAEQPRIVSIRECARAQGFRDYDQFYGSLQDKYRQIDNAV